MLGFEINTKKIATTLLLFFSLNIIWAFCCVITDEFTKIDKGFVTGLGFILLLAISFYFGQNRRKVEKLLSLTTIFYLIFLVSSFLISIIILKVFGDSYTIYAIASSVFTSTALTLTLNRIYGIQYLFFTIVLTTILSLLAQYIIQQISSSIYFIGDYYTIQE